MTTHRVNYRLARLVASAVVIAGLGALASPAQAACDRNNPDCLPPGPAPTPPATCPPPDNLPNGPAYTVRAVNFKVLDETHDDRLGSDEVFWVFSSEGAEGTSSTKKSPKFGDSDTGETKSFGSSSWIAGNTCTPLLAPAGIGFSIQAYEHDYGDMEWIREQTEKAFEKTAQYIEDYPYIGEWVADKIRDLGSVVDGWIGDDLVGTKTFAYSPQTLASVVPHVGDTFRKTLRFSGGASSAGADYNLTIEVKKIRDKILVKL